MSEWGISRIVIDLADGSVKAECAFGVKQLPDWATLRFQWMACIHPGHELQNLVVQLCDYIAKDLPGVTLPNKKAET